MLSLIRVHFHVNQIQLTTIRGIEGKGAETQRPKGVNCFNWFRTVIWKPFAQCISLKYF